MNRKQNLWIFAGIIALRLIIGFYSGILSLGPSQQTNVRCASDIPYLPIESPDRDPAFLASV